MSKFRTFFKSQAGITGIDYALIAFLIAAGLAVSLALFGRDLRSIFEHTSNQVAGTEPPASIPSDGKPSASLTVANASVPYLGTATFHWITTDATSVAAKYNLAGNCSQKTTVGAGPYDLAWSGAGGTASIAWSANIGGCSVSACLTAKNAKGDAKSCATASYASLNTTPSNIDFPQTAGVEPGSDAVSAERTIAGIDAPVNASSSGGEFRLSGGAWTTSSTAAPNTPIELKQRSATTFATDSTMNVTVGSMTKPWTIRTRDKDVTPDAFEIAGKTADPDTDVDSYAVQPTGFDSPVAWSVTGGTASVDGGAAATSGEISEGQTIILHGHTSKTFGGSADMSLTVGDTTVSWKLDTREAVTVATLSGSFGDQTGIDPAATAFSNPVQATGFDGALTATASGAEISKDGTSWGSSVSIVSGDSIRLKMTASSGYLASSTATATVGTGTSAQWQVTTRDRIVAPVLAGSFAQVSGAEPSTTHDSGEAGSDPQVNGFEGSLDAQATGGAVLSTDGGSTYAASANITSGTHVRLKGAAPAGYSASSTYGLDVGGTHVGDWSVGTRAMKTVASLDHAFANVDAPGIDPSTGIDSDSAHVLGFDGTLTATATGGTFSVNGGSATTSASVKAGDAIVLHAVSSGSFGGSATVELTVGSTDLGGWTVATRAKDELPNRADFVALVGQQPNATVATASAATLAGFDGPITISATGATISTDGGQSFATTATVNPDDTVMLQAVTAGYSQTVHAVLHAPGGDFGAWDVTTRDKITAPVLANSFTTPDPATIEPSTSHDSNDATVIGFDGTLVASSATAQISKDHGQTWGASAEISSGDAIRLRATSSATFSGNTLAEVTVGTTDVGGWTLTTRAIKTVPTLSGSFAPVTGAEPGAAVATSGYVTVTGFDGTLTATSDDGTVSTDGSAFGASATVSSGSKIWLASSAPASFAAPSKTVHLTVGSVTNAASWSISLRAMNTVPTLSSNFVDIGAPGVDPSTSKASNTVQVQGFDGTLAASASGGELKVNGGAWSAGPTTVSSGDSVTLRTTSASAWNGSAQAVLTVGSTAFTPWTVATRAQDVTPDAIVFAAANGVDKGSTQTSNAISATGFDSSIQVTATNGLVSVNGAAYTAGPVTVAQGDSLAMQATAGDYGQAVNASLSSSSGTFATWSVTTRAMRTVPTVSGSFATVAGVEPGSAQQTTDYVTVSGFDGNLNASSDDGTVSTDGSSFSSSATVSDGSKIYLRASAPADFSNPTKTVHLTVGSVADAASWTISLRDKATVPTLSAGFVNLGAPGVDPSSVQTSNTVKVQGFDGTLAASVAGGLVQVNTGTWTAGPVDVASGDNVTLRATANSAWNGSAQAVLTVGDVSFSPWSVQTRAQDVVPDTIAFTATSGVEKASTQTSNQATLTGFDGPVQITATNAKVSVNGAAYTAGPVSVSLNDKVTLQATAGEYGQQVQANLSGPSGAFASWTVTTRAKIVAPAIIGSFTQPDPATVDPNSTQQSNQVQATGFDETLTASAANALLSVNGGAYGATATVSSGDKISLQATASANYDTAVQPVLSIGGVQVGSWTVKTRQMRTVPTVAGSFTAKTGAELSTAYASATSVTIGGFDGTLAVTASPATSLVTADNGSSWANSVSVPAGSVIGVKAISSSDFANPSNSTTVTAGATQIGTFSTTLRAKDTAPDAIVFTAASGVEKASLQTSNQATLAGFDGPIQVTATNAQMSVNGAAYTAGPVSVSTGDKVTLQATAGDYSQQVQASLSGPSGTFASWTVTTRAKLVAPAMVGSFVQPDPATVDPNSTQQSNQVQVTGFDDTLTASSTSGKVSVNGAAYAASATVAAGDKVSLQATASASYDTAVQPALVVGGVQVGSWTVKTRTMRTVPTVTGTFTDATGIEPSTTIPSATSVTLTGFDGNLVVTASPSTSLVTSNGGASWTNSVTVASGAVIGVEATSASDWTTPTNTTTVTAGSTTIGTFKTTLRAQKTVPDTVSFGTLANQEPGASGLVSNIVQVTGIDAGVSLPLTITPQVNGGGTPSGNYYYKIDGGAQVSYGTPVSLKKGQQLQLVAQAGANFLDSTTMTVTLGTTNIGTFTVQTRDRVQVPTPFIHFTAVTGDDIGDVDVSNRVAPAGFEGTITVTGVNAQVAVADDSTVADEDLSFVDSVTILPGDIIAMKAQASSSYNATVTPQLSSNGTVFADWSITTKTIDETPTAIAFADATGAPGTSVQSASAATMAGFDGYLNFTIANGSAIVTSAGTSVAGDAVQSGTVSVGDTVSLVGIVPGWDANGAVQTNPVTITFTGPNTGATYSATFNVKTTAKDNVPDAITLAAVSPAEPKIWYYAPLDASSNPTTVDLTGFDGPISISSSATNGGQTQFSLDSGATWQTSASGVMPGTPIEFRTMVNGYDTGYNSTATYTLGGGSATWALTARPVATKVCDPMVFTSTLGNDPATAVVSNVDQAASGFNGTVTLTATNGTVSTSTDGGASWSAYAASKTLVASGTLVRLTATTPALDATNGRAAQKVVKLACTSGSTSNTFVWNIGTRAPNLVPTNASPLFADSLANAVSTATGSGSVVLTGMEAPASVQLSPADGNTKLTINGTVYATPLTSTLKVAKNATIALTSTSPAQWNYNLSAGANGAPKVVTLTIGGKSYTWNVGTRIQDVDPNPLTINNVNPAAISTLIPNTTAAQTLAGFDGSLTMTVTTDAPSTAAPQVYVSSVGAWKAIPSGGYTAIVKAGNTFNMRLTTLGSPNYNKPYNFFVKYGPNQAYTWNVTSRPYNSGGCAAKTLAYSYCSATWAAGADAAILSKTWSGSHAYTGSCASGYTGQISYSDTLSGTGKGLCYDGAWKLQSGTCSVTKTTQTGSTCTATCTGMSC